MGRLVTSWQCPPVPWRNFDWAAYDDDYEPADVNGEGGGIVGWGRTEAEAIADYRNQLADETEGAL